ncbi:unnamed protein product [Gongylonema pulchrum]|uniref:Protein kinase domain-containing protein n=1 Tax=Gongylonema pulchrum TaxID=637853 RepID=A0A183EGS2_9BILA|nr:unnamed protein product [Gongylonema pulchrum]
MAPEIAKETCYGQEVDWWAYGVLLHVLHTNRYPYPNCELLNVNIEKRMKTFAQMKSHPFFDGINWDDVALRKVNLVLLYFLSHSLLNKFFYQLSSCPSETDSNASTLHTSTVHLSLVTLDNAVGRDEVFVLAISSHPLARLPIALSFKRCFEVS